ncbi:MAG: hypothetical protein E2O74_06575 [Chloroflexi bacterium]|nr:MAG: hypothetical protein E2O74_06575 [Chloroflexota bacterium]
MMVAIRPRVLLGLASLVVTIACGTATSAPILTPAPASTFAATPTAAPTLDYADVTLAASEATIDFPDSIDFLLSASSALPLRKVDLEFGTDHVYSCATREYSSVRLDFEPDTEVELSWEWELKKTGSIPPGTVVWWRWRFQDEGGRSYLSHRQELEYEDKRFQWQSLTQDNITLHWYTGGRDFAADLAQAMAGGLASLELGSDLVQPIQAFIYADAEDVQGAILFAQEWTGGLAFGSQNILLITISPERAEEEVSGLVHELAHLLIQELTFNCFGGLPPWLNEGLATYAEGPLAPYQQSALDRAAAEDTLITVRSLSSSFPAGHGGASLSYAQSQSLVAYLIDTYGWAKMRELLAVFQGGSTYDDALLQIYALNMDVLDHEWRASLGLLEPAAP